MQGTKVDYIIVGQGLAGSWLSYELIKRGHSIVVINHLTENTSSRKAAGLYNPITGRKMVKTWRADDFFPTLEKDYHELEKVTGKQFLYPIPIYRPFQTVENQNDWQGQQGDFQNNTYLNEIRTESIGIEHILDELGGIILNHSGFVDLPTFLNSFKKYLSNKGIYHEQVFDYSKMEVEKHQVKYKEWEADKVIFCEGPSKGNPYWESLPFRLVRGETIDIECDLESNLIINQGVFMIPKGTFFTVGSTYDHSILSYEPQESGVRNIEERMSKIFSGNYRIITKRAGIRPATHDRKPYIGFHKKYSTIGIFNGFGTKGVSLSPYFARHFADVLENSLEIDKEVDVQRVL